MRLVERHPVDKLPTIDRTPERDERLSAFLTIDLEDALTARRTVDRVWNEARRQYNAVPKRVMREVPIPNAPNVEIPVGAILADDIYAQATDTMFTASPMVTVRPIEAKWVEHAKAMQDWVNWLVQNEIDLRTAANNALLDDTQLGTGVYYIPFVEQTKKDKVYKTTYQQARVFAHAVEDLLIPPGSRGDIQRDRWVGLRFWYTKGELEERARKHGWDIEGCLPTAQFDLVRLQHERKANLRGAQLWREVYEVIEVYAYFDYDEDGLEEDILVTFDRTSRKILALSFNPYDIRPIEVMRYQLRSNLPYGIGIMEMVQPFQEEITEMHNYTTLNIFLANARIWAVKQGAIDETTEITPGRVIKVQGDDVRTGIMELKMSEVYPSAFQAQASALMLAERRIGTSGAAGMLAKGGSRTPGVTALSLLQQVNRRFAPAFDDMREKTGAAIRQAVYRYRERVKANDKNVKDSILMVMGAERAEYIFDLLNLDAFDKSVAVELTASTASVNREADRQNSMLISQLLQGYYQQMAGLAMQAAQTNLPENVRNVLVDIATKGSEMMDRTLRTFEQIRDPQRFLIDLQKVETAIQTPPDIMTQIISAMGQAGAAGTEPAPEPGFTGVA